MESRPPEVGLPLQPFTALVLAGGRRGDAVARAAGVSHKALAPVAGVPMLTRVVGVLRAARAVHRIVVCGMERDGPGAQAELLALLGSGDLELIDAQATPSSSVLHAMQALAPCLPLLVATADHPLLTAEIIETFCVQSAVSSTDVAFGLVPASIVRAAFPAIRRTTLPFRDGAYCGCNLYAFLTPDAQRAAAAWVQVEPHRKRPWCMVTALGVGVMLRFLLRRLTLAAVLQLAAERMRVRLSPIF